MTVLEAAYLMHWLANRFGVSHSVSVAQSLPVERCVAVPLFGEDVA